MRDLIIFVLAFISLIGTLFFNYAKLFWLYSITDTMWMTQMGTIVIDSIVIGMIIRDYIKKRLNKKEEKKGAKEEK